MSETKPIIATANIITSSSYISVDSNMLDSNTAKVLYDRNRDTKYSINFGSYKIITIDFQTSKTFDIIVLNNHNFKDFVIYYYDPFSSIWIQLGFAIGNTQKDNFFKFKSPITCRVVRIVVNALQSGSTLEIAEIWITKTWYEFERNFDTYNKQKFRKQDIYRLGMGEMKMWWIYEKYKASIVCNYCSETMINSLKEIWDSPDAFTFIPEPDDMPSDIYLCHIINEFNAQYISNWKGAGYTITLEIEEV